MKNLFCFLPKKLRCQSILCFTGTLIFMLCSTVINALEWESCGLDNESINTILIDPRNDDIVYVGSRSNFSDGIYGKIFKSTDGGATWDTLLYGVDPLDIAIHPDSSHNLYVALGMANFTPPGIIKTTDSGANWVKMDSGVRVDWETGVHSIAIDPMHPDTLFAGTGGFWGGNLYYSYNAGESWTNVVPHDIDCPGEGWPDICRLTNSIVRIIINPIHSSILYVGNDRSGDIMKSTDGGKTWTLTGLSDQGIIWDLLMDKQDSEILFASSSKGFYKTVDGGNNWDDLNNGREKPFKVR